MATLNELTSDIELRLTSGNISDDFNLDKRLIRHWISISRSVLVKQKWDTEGSDGIESFITFFPCVKIEEEKIDCQCTDPFRYIVKLPESIVALPRDLGVYRIELQSGQTIDKIKITDQTRFKNLRFPPNKNSRITYFREDQQLIIQGGDYNLMKNGKVNLYLIVASTDTIDPDEEYPISAALLPKLLEMVEEIGRRTLSTPEDVVDDGAQGGMENNGTQAN